VTTPALLDHFDLASLDDLPRIEELLQVGLITSGAPPAVPSDEDADADPEATDESAWSGGEAEPSSAGGSG
jgi:hypothetical protein